MIDFDRVTRDPRRRRSSCPAYDSGDHLHPGDAGYKAMGEAIDLALLVLRTKSIIVHSNLVRHSADRVHGVASRDR